jgi:LuxR family maltose regulon positive regulatory protein
VTGQLHAARGQHRAALEAFAAGASTQSLLDGSHALATPLVGWLAATQARLGAPDEARETLSGFPDDRGRTGFNGVCNARAVICMAEGNPAGALDVLRDVPGVTPPIGPAFTLAESHLLTGLAYLELGDRSAAAAAAEAALAAAEPDRLVFPFAFTEAAQLLGVLPRHETAHGAFLAHVIDVLHGDQRPLSEPAELSPSELRVLRYLPTNLTRPEIARELYISVNTVNTHIRNIYAKLDASGRAAAVQRARELRLVATGGSRRPAR